MCVSDVQTLKRRNLVLAPSIIQSSVPNPIPSIDALGQDGLRRLWSTLGQQTKAVGNNMPRKLRIPGGGMPAAIAEAVNHAASAMAGVDVRARLGRKHPENVVVQIGSGVAPADLLALFLAAQSLPFAKLGHPW
jgi:hypothetical protein